MQRVNANRQILKQHFLPVNFYLPYDRCAVKQRQGFIFNLTEVIDIQFQADAAGQTGYFQLLNIHQRQRTTQIQLLLQRRQPSLFYQLI